jgi:hypothetical protein
MAIDTYMHNIDLDTVQHAIVLLGLLFAIFVFSLIWLRLQVGARGGVEGECMHTPIANGQSLLRLRFNSLSSACNCSVFVTKCFLPLLIQIAKLCYIHFVWSSKAHSSFSMITNQATQKKEKEPIYSTLKIYK